MLIWKNFKSTVEWRFLFWNIFFRFEDINIFALCKLATWWCHQVDSLTHWLLELFAKSAFFGHFGDFYAGSQPNYLWSGRKCVCNTTACLSCHQHHSLVHCDSGMEVFFALPFSPFLLFLLHIVDVKNKSQKIQVKIFQRLA